MEKIKRVLKKIWKWEGLPFAALAVAVFIPLLFVSLYTGDDIYFTEAARHMGIIDFLGLRFDTWTSRVVIEFFLYFFSQNSFLFRVVDALMYGLLAWSLYKLLPVPKARWSNWLVVLLIAFIPVEIYFSAGWLTTNVHYLWVTTLGVFSLIPLRKIADGSRFAWYEYPAYLIALVYAVNNEQLMVAVGLSYGLFFLYRLFTRRKIEVFVLLGGGISLASLAVALWSPGNAARKAAEILNWFPAFDQLSILKKVEMAFASTFFQFFFNIDGIFLALTFLIMVLMWKRFRNPADRILGAIPFGIISFFGYFYKGAKVVLAFLENTDRAELIHVIRRPAIDYGTVLNLDYGMLVPAYILVLIGAGSILYCLYRIFEGRSRLRLVLAVLGTGLLTRLLMGLSPTLFASGLRTFLTLYCCLIFVDLLLFQEVVQSFPWLKGRRRHKEHNHHQG